METVAQPPADAELHLLTEWGDPNSRSRTRKAAVLSVAAHAVVIGLLAMIPADVLKPPENVARVITPLIEPLTELTQKAPNKGKVSKEFNAVEEQPRPRLRIPAPTPPPAPRASLPPAPAPKPQAVPLPEAPAIQQAIKEPPKTELPPVPLPPPPQIQATEKKPVFEAPPAQSTPLPPGKGQVPIPDTSVAGAVRTVIRGGSGMGMTIGDPEAMGPGGFGTGINQAPTPGGQASAMQLLSNPMGVDFAPYLTRILIIVRRNWFSVMPESAKLGLRGRVGVLFAIAKNGTVTRANFAAQSGARALDQAAIAAISMSNPFPPLPTEFKGDRIVLQFNFAYNTPKQ